jgi:methionyl-tRNA formyltransferase
MKILFIGSVHLSAFVLRKLIDMDAEICGIVTKQSSNFNTDFEDLTPIGKHHNIPCHYTNNPNSEESIAWIRRTAPDIIFCFGWSTLIKNTLLDLPPMGVLGFHPAALPKNRGRHPLIWALVLGLSETASSFFFMDEGADSGDLLSQREIKIAENETAASLYQKVVETALKQVADFLPKLATNSYQRQPQDHSKANLWRKRSSKDGMIDFRMSSQTIDRLVRGLSPPYPGAQLNFQDTNITIWQTQPENTGAPNIEPGKVLAVNDNHILVKCSEGAIWLTDHEFVQLPEVGDYL